MRVNRAVELVPAKAVVNELDEESMGEGWSCGLEADEWVVQDWQKGEKELAEARELEYTVDKLNMFEFCSEGAMRAVTSEAPTSTKCVDVRRGIREEQVGGQRLSSPTRGTGQARFCSRRCLHWRRRRCHSS